MVTSCYEGGRPPAGYPVIDTVICPSPQVSDVAMLEQLDGGLVLETEFGLAVMYDPDSDIESRLTGTLRAHFPEWLKIGVGEFALSVIQNGYIPKLGKMPDFYAEGNNKSYCEHAEFANEAVMKLLRVGVVNEVPRASLRHQSTHCCSKHF